MTEQAVGESVARLLDRHPNVPWATIARVLEDAYATVANMTGRPDLELAEDLAELRLQIRARVDNQR